MIHEEEVIPSIAYCDWGRIELTGYRRAIAGSYAFYGGIASFYNAIPCCRTTERNDSEICDCYSVGPAMEITPLLQLQTSSVKRNSAT